MPDFDFDDLPIDDAAIAVRRMVGPSPCLPSPSLSECLGVEVYLKYENLQVTGAFKVRGAAARLSALDTSERARGVVTCSSGNHGKAVAWVAGRLGIPAIVCVPGWVDPVKLAAIEGAGAEARRVGSSYDEAEEEAERIAAEEGRVMIPPFDDPWIAAGQGTVASEILDVVPDPAEVLVALSGGGLAGGMAEVLSRRGLPGRITAVSAARADVMRRSLAAGRPVRVPEEETLASALAGGIGLDNRVTFPLVRDRITRFLDVQESAIADAIRDAWSHHGVLLEGGGAVALAGLLARAAGTIDASEAPVPARGPIVVVLSGGNLDPGRLRELFAAGVPAEGADD